MSVDSAVAYIKRMRSDNDFRAKMNDISEDEEASWQAVREAGYEFTMSEFKQGQEVVYEENDIVPM
jgi:predicted ribosomally synthesized peptide with nif11-like leader